MFDENIDETLAILNAVCEAMPLKQPVDDSVIDRLREALIAYRFEGVLSFDDKNPLGKFKKSISYKEVSRTIDAEFEAVTTKFDKFSLKIGEDTLSRFEKNVTSRDTGKNEGINTKNDSIRLIAAFLLLPTNEKIQLEDLRSDYYGYTEYKLFQRFFDTERELSSGAKLCSLSGAFSFEREYNYVSLKLTPSSDGTHLIIEENLIRRSQSGYSEGDVISTSTGFGFVTGTHVIHIFLRGGCDFTYTYKSLTDLAVLNAKDKKQESLNLLKSFYPYEVESVEGDELVDELLDNLEKSLFLFKRNSNVLTFPLLKADKTLGVGTDDKVHPFGGKKRSAALKMEGVLQMTEEEQRKLNKKMFVAACELDFETLAEALSKGAEINYQDPSTGATIMHVIASTGSVDFYNVAMDASKEEPNPLIRSKSRDALPSQHALHKGTNDSNSSEHEHPGDLYLILKEKELRAAAELGYRPGVTSRGDTAIEVENAPPPPGADGPSF